MATAYWCIVEDDRKGSPKKVMAEVLGEAGRLAGANVEAVWLTDKASDEGIKQLGAWGASKVWVLENAAFAPYMGEVWVPDRKSTRLNSSHITISYAVFCLKKKKKEMIWIWTLTKR